MTSSYPNNINDNVLKFLEKAIEQSIHFYYISSFLVCKEVVQNCFNKIAFK